MRLNVAGIEELEFWDHNDFLLTNLDSEGESSVPRKHKDRLTTSAIACFHIHRALQGTNHDGKSLGLEYTR